MALVTDIRICGRYLYEYLSEDDQKEYWRRVEEIKKYDAG